MVYYGEHPRTLSSTGEASKQLRNNKQRLMQT